MGTSSNIEPGSPGGTVLPRPPNQIKVALGKVAGEVERLVELWHEEKKKLKNPQEDRDAVKANMKLMSTEISIRLKAHEVVPENDGHNSMLLARRFADRIKYPGEYFVWDDRRWWADKKDKKKPAITHLASQHVKQLKEDILAMRFPPDIEEALIKQTVPYGNGGPIGYAKNLLPGNSRDQKIPCEFDATFDRDPLLMNVLNGTIDLRTGKLRPHDPADCLTGLAPVVYDPDLDPEAACPTWMRFIKQVSAEKWGAPPRQDLIAFLQRLTGYFLVGDNREEKFFILHGPGGSGKTKYIGVHFDLLGDLATSTDVTTFTENRFSEGRIPAEIADIAFARLVSVAEPKKEAILDEAKIKVMTGRDRKLQCRFLYGNPFHFDPKFKIVFLTNQKLIIRTFDRAMTRRLVPIPFSASVPDKAIDESLPEKLRAELPGILRWAVLGCIAWQERGLDENSVLEIVKLRETYRSNIDPLLQVRMALESIGTKDDGMRTPFADIQRAYKTACERNDWAPVGDLGKKLKELGFVSEHKASGQHWGIRLREPVTDPAQVAEESGAMRR